MSKFYYYNYFILTFEKKNIIRDSTIRPGWVTVGPELTNSNFNSENYTSYFNDGQYTTGCTERIEALRPKSPQNNTRGRGRGMFSRGGTIRGRPR